MSADLFPDAEKLTLRHGSLTFDALAIGPRTGPLVLFLHGFPEFATCWRGLMAAAAQAGYRAVAVDQRGYSPGARPDNVADYSGEHLVGDIFGFADALGAERFHLVGHDWGGVIAWPAAAGAPDRISTLTVLSTAHPSALSTVLAESAEQREHLAYFELFRAEGEAERILLADGAAALRDIYQERVPADLVDDNIRRLSDPGVLTAALNWYRAMSRGDYQVPAVSVPTLYLWGTEDLAFTRQAAERTACWVTGPYEFVDLDGATHWLPEEDPERIIPPILAHLKSHA
ncbi:pimeloyl-ACP methyl ester carboxylesterase [Lipingzhangella halophila]|uniref:Pimeloyl-ACP methyl ester carboxylesterase n=1 Tax=Lipingzhangella halophila TaxID=1783352 RepID=A0A7W7W2B3_9ACTN|nr:alpha/beta hydrolase [Lipingzhangella halophila]MBB4931576.1 pimeloyl-ACP methyl ester carboxylesterase [Lipingzhangella halophila]